MNFLDKLKLRNFIKIIKIKNSFENNMLAASIIFFKF